MKGRAPNRRAPFPRQRP